MFFCVYFALIMHVWMLVGPNWRAVSKYDVYWSWILVVNEIWRLQLAAVWQHLNFKNFSQSHFRTSLSNNGCSLLVAVCCSFVFIQHAHTHTHTPYNHMSVVSMKWEIERNCGWNKADRHKHIRMKFENLSRQNPNASLQHTTTTKQPIDYQ